MNIINIVFIRYNNSNSIMIEISFIFKKNTQKIRHYQFILIASFLRLYQPNKTFNYYIAVEHSIYF